MAGPGDGENWSLNCEPTLEDEETEPVVEGVAR